MERCAKTILIVDDMKLVCEPLAFALRTRGYDVVCASNGKEGLRALREHEPDAVLLDLMMPVMDGYQFLRAMQMNASLPRPPVLVLTAVSDRSCVVKATRLGAVDYLLKSAFRLEELLDRIERCVERANETEEDDDDRFCRTFDYEAGEPGAADACAREHRDTAHHEGAGDRQAAGTQESPASREVEPRSRFSSHTASSEQSVDEEHRRNFRIGVNNLPVTADVGSVRNCPVIDVGFGGFAVLSDVPLRCDDVLPGVLRRSREDEGEGIVRVCSAVEAEQGVFRCGLRVVNEESTLHELLRDIVMEVQRARARVQTRN